jgi:hypothetical protein
VGQELARRSGCRLTRHPLRRMQLFCSTADKVRLKATEKKVNDCCVCSLAGWLVRNLRNKKRLKMAFSGEKAIFRMAA